MKKFGNCQQFGLRTIFSIPTNARNYRRSLLINKLAHIPTIDIIEHDNQTLSGFNKHWHTHGDNMDNITKETLQAVGQTILEVVYNE